MIDQGLPKFTIDKQKKYCQICSVHTVTVIVDGNDICLYPHHHRNSCFFRIVSKCKVNNTHNINDIDLNEKSADLDLFLYEGLNLVLDGMEDDVVKKASNIINALWNESGMDAGVFIG